MSSLEEEEKESEKIQLLSERLAVDVDETPLDDTQFKQAIITHSRVIRSALTAIILLMWALFMIPYDLYGASILDDYGLDRNMFIISLYIWLVAHVALVISSLLSLITMRYCQHSRGIAKAVLLLIMISTTLQIIGTLLFAYSYCLSLTNHNENVLWSACMLKAHGLYLLYNAGFIAYFGFILFAEHFHGALPIFSIWRCHSNDQQRFSRNFRISYLSSVSFIGMCLILVYGFTIYESLGPSFQAIYIGYTFLLVGTLTVLLTQCIFHLKCSKKSTDDNESRSNSIDTEYLSSSPLAITSMRTLKKKKNAKWKQNCENVLHLIAYFLILAGIVLVFMYSLVSRIPEAAHVIERLRLIGNMCIICGLALVICYEMYTKSDDYDDDVEDDMYTSIQDNPNSLAPALRDV